MSDSVFERVSNEFSRLKEIEKIIKRYKNEKKKIGCYSEYVREYSSLKQKLKSWINWGEVING